jgi:hypothetical protein
MFTENAIRDLENKINPEDEHINKERWLVRKT